jgi:hypothetical protein
VVPSFWPRAGPMNVTSDIVGGLTLRETSRQNRAVLQQSREVLELQRRGQVTERFTRAIEQLGQRGDEKLDVRIGAVYALEQIAHDSRELHWPIMEVLTSHLRCYSRYADAATEVAEVAASDLQQSRSELPADIQAIATVIARRQCTQDPPSQRLDLHEVNLERVQWTAAQLSGVRLRQAHLVGADLRQAQLTGADLRDARLAGADLRDARLESHVTSEPLELLNLVVQRDKGGAIVGATDLWC